MYFSSVQRPLVQAKGLGCLSTRCTGEAQRTRLKEKDIYKFANLARPPWNIRYIINQVHVNAQLQGITHTAQTCTQCIITHYTGQYMYNVHVHVHVHKCRMYVYMYMYTRTFNLVTWLSRDNVVGGSITSKGLHRNKQVKLKITWQITWLTHLAPVLCFLARRPGLSGQQQPGL